LGAHHIILVLLRGFLVVNQRRGRKLFNFLDELVEGFRLRLQSLGAWSHPASVAEIFGFWFKPNNFRRRIILSRSEQAKKLLEHAINKLGLSARAYSRVLKVARTIADLAGSAEIESSHIAEAIQ
jgi:magnesium chelatase subunit ChlI-like protein